MYVYLKKWGNTLYSTYYHNNEKRLKKIKPEVDVFIPTSKKNTDYKVFPSNKEVEKMTFKTINDYKDFKENINTSMIYGNLGQYHHELNHIRKYKLYENINSDLLKVFFVDIETAKGPEGYSKPNDAKEPITEISIIDRTSFKCVIWGYCNYKAHEDNIEYRKFDCEDEMLVDFCKYIGMQNPDVLIGWNTIWYDYPYIYNRLKEVFKENSSVVASSMSPFNKVVDKQYFNRERGETANSMDIFGTLLLDMMDIYKKYTPSKKSSYSLDNIAQEELGAEKLDYGEYGDLETLYQKNTQMYTEYLYQDVKLLYDLDKKQNFINRIFGICHYARMPIEKYNSPVLMWESIMFNELMDKNMVFPPKKHYETTDRIEGAYVKEPVPGLYDYFASCDVNSEYPHVIILNNMSPETKLEKFPDAATEKIARKITVNKMVKETIDLQPFKDANICIAANGSIYRKDIKGIGPILMEKLYNQRKEHKNKMLKIAAALESGKFDGKDKAKVKLKISNLDNLQWAEKIILNSFYGAFSNMHFRFYDKEIAEAITLTAQTVIKTAERGLNTYMNKVMKTENEDYIIYVDTDSCYINCESLVKMFMKKKPEATTENIVDFLNKFFNKKIEPELTKIFTRMYEYTGAYEDCIVMKREVIAESGFWLKKKKYVMKIWDDEGKRFKEPKLKMKGIQVVRSDTPKAIKKYLKELINKILDKGNVKKYIKNVKKIIIDMDTNDIAVSKSANNIEKYSEISKTGELCPKKGCPIHVRAAIVHNGLINEMNLKNKLEEIKSGDKLKFVYLKMPNPLDQHVIGFQGDMPKEFDLFKYVDKEKQYFKIFGKIAEDMCNALGISIKNKLF